MENQPEENDFFWLQEDQDHDLISALQTSVSYIFLLYHTIENNT